MQAFVRKLERMKAAKLAEIVEIDQMIKQLQPGERKQKKYDFSKQLNNRKQKLLQK